MKITKITHHGQTRFRVNDPHGPDGKRQRKFFDTREAAEDYVKTRTADTRAFGIHFTTIPPNERAAIVYQLQRLTALGWTLPAAVDFIEKHGKAAPSLPLGTVADEFLATKTTAGLRPRYVKTLRASIHRFLLNRRNKLIADVTSAEIQEYITSNGWLPATIRVTSLTCAPPLLVGAAIGLGLLWLLSKKEDHAPLPPAPQNPAPAPAMYATWARNTRPLVRRPPRAD